MSDKKQYDLMYQVLRTHQANLTKVLDNTRNYKLIDKINAALMRIGMVYLDIEHAWSEVEGKWASADEVQGLQKNWREAIEGAQNADEEIAKFRWQRGWQWFRGFALALIVLVGGYIFLHWRFPSADPEIFLWTDNPRTYIEVAWWAFFGLLTWVLYNLQHYVRAGYDISLYSIWYLSKILQGVFIAIVIVVSFKQIDFGTTITNSIIPVVMGFILGYYSDRAQKYLELIRDKLFSGTQVPKVTIEPIEPISMSPVFVRGKVEDGPLGTEGTLMVNKNPATLITIDGRGSFAEWVELPVGRNLIKVEAKSPAKRVGVASVAVNLPGPKPVVTINAPQKGSAVTSGKVTVSGTVKDEKGTPYSGLNIFLLPERSDPVSVAVGENGSFSREVEVTEGENLIRVLLGTYDNNPELKEVVKTIQI